MFVTTPTFVAMFTISCAMRSLTHFLALPVLLTLTSNHILIQSSCHRLWVCVALMALPDIIMNLMSYFLPIAIGKYLVFCNYFVDKVLK